jgi:hypothetical protein
MHIARRNMHIAIESILPLTYVHTTNVKFPIGWRCTGDYWSNLGTILLIMNPPLTEKMMACPLDRTLITTAGLWRMVIAQG